MSIEKNDNIQQLTIAVANSNSNLGRVEWTISIDPTAEGYVSLPHGYTYRNLNPALVKIQSLVWNVQGEPLLSYEMTPEGTHKVLLPADYASTDPTWHWIRTGSFLATVKATALVLQDSGWVTEHIEKTALWTVKGPIVERLVTKALPPEFFEINPDLEITKRYASMGWYSDNEALGINDKGFSMEATIKKQPSSPNGVLRCVQLVKALRITIHEDGSSSQLDTIDYKLDLSDTPPAYGEDRDFRANCIFEQNDSPANEVRETDRDFIWQDKFKMYFMYKAYQPGSIWVTLCKVNWDIDVRITNGHNWVKNIYPNMGLPGRAAVITARSTELPEWNGMVSGDDVRRYDDIKLIEYQRDSSLWAIIQEFVFQDADADIEKETGRKACATFVPVRGKIYSVFWGPKDVLTSSALVLKELIPFDVQKKWEGLDMPPKKPGTKNPFYVFKIQIAPFCFGPSIEYWRKFAHAPQDPDGYDGDFSAYNYLKQVRRVIGETFPSIRCELKSEKELRFIYDKIPDMQILRNIARIPQTYSIERYDTKPDADDPDFPID